MFHECSEGFVSAEVLASSLEKAWLSLHIQVFMCMFFLLFFNNILLLSIFLVFQHIIVLLSIVRTLTYYYCLSLRNP